MGNTAKRADKPSRGRILAWGLVLAAVFSVRIMFASSVSVPLRGDAGHYYYIAKHLIHDGYYGVDEKPDDLRTPGYPLVLAGVSKFLFNGDVSQGAINTINFVSDLLSVLLLLVLGSRVGMGLALPGILFVALSPFWFSNVNIAVTEPMSIALFLAFLERWTRDKPTTRDLAWAGAFLGALSVTRAMYFFFPAGVALFHWGLPVAFGAYGRWRGEKKTVIAARAQGWHAGLKPELRAVAAFLAAGYVFPIAWGVRNAISVGEFAMTQPVIGTTMAYVSVHIPLMDFREPDLAQKYFDLPLIRKAEKTHDLAVFDEMRAEVRDFILHHPQEFLANAWPKLVRLWVTGWENPYSYIDSAKTFGPMYIWVFCVPVLIFGLVGVFLTLRRNWKAKGAASEIRFRMSSMQVLLALYITAVTTPLIVDARYSMNAYVLFGLWMGLGWTACFGALSSVVVGAERRKTAAVAKVDARKPGRATERPSRSKAA